jgi:hypothetical protein
VRHGEKFTKIRDYNLGVMTEANRLGGSPFFGERDRLASKPALSPGRIVTC